MATNSANDPRHEYSSTYFMKERSNRDEMTRLAIQDQLITSGMGGVLPEQPDAANFKRILDVACGTGGWLIEVAKTYPDATRLIGVDVNRHIIEYAQKQAEAAQIDERVEFQSMDALLILEFPRDYFDLVNIRFATSFMRTWNWPKLLSEMQRVARPNGVVRITEYERVTASSPAAMQLFKLIGDAFYNAGHLFAEGKTEDTFSEYTIGVASDLERLMSLYGFENVQTLRSTQECPIDTPAGRSFAEDLQLGFRTTIPFIRKWGRLPDNYETIYQEMVDAMRQSDYTASWTLRTAWGTKPTTVRKSRE